MKINVRSTEVIRPVLQHLLAATDEITSPVVLHANIFRSPRSIEVRTQSYYPDATLSIGWTKNNITEIPLRHRKFGWREVFKLLSLIKDVEQAVMISLRLTVAVHSTEEISFLLGIRDTIAVLIWSDDTDVIDDWSGLASLRSGAYNQRILFDLDEKHRKVLHSLPKSLIITEYPYNKDKWRSIEFPYASSTTSGVIESNDGAAFLGWPNSFLVSLQIPPVFPKTQTVAGKLTFVRKKYLREENQLGKSGLVIYLVDKIIDVQSPEIDYGVKIFIGYKGLISIENRDAVEQQYQTRAVGQLRKENCYYFELIDR
ncbi:unnamed protein product [Enterobius vermicularis]|uniref:FBA_2 domain-containing protein n=1 Tax=Enterobius vermicularis TaxID=51028 RepID=A0A0N4VK81_ENTVE|nr:unnamed protein product [Enterobius vermicularis]